MDSINYEELAKEVIKQQGQRQEQTPQNHKEAVISVLKEQMTAHQQSTLQSTTSQLDKQKNEVDTSINDNLPSYSLSAPLEAKQEVENLISFTLEKGLSQGIAHAKKSDPFVIDMYHDALAEHIVGQMKEKGLL